LGGFRSPAELVSTIGRQGDPSKSCELLSDLLVLAQDDGLARRAVLQAVLPGLQQAAFRRWRRAQGRGPWCSQHDVLVESVGAGWQMIAMHSGHRHERPAAVIVRGAEGQLRRAQDKWRNESANTLPLTDVFDRVCDGGDPGLSPEAQALECIAAAAQAGILTPTEAAVLTMSGVLGYPVVAVARVLDLPPGQAPRALAQGRASLRNWLGDPLQYQERTILRSSPRRAPPWVPITSIADLPPALPTALGTTEDPSMPPLLLKPTAAARLLDISRSKLYELITAGEINTVTIGSSRRIVYDDLLAYVQRLQRHRPADLSDLRPPDVTGRVNSRIPPVDSGARSYVATPERINWCGAGNPG
jgi:excisionase family DNA binding protein